MAGVASVGSSVAVNTVKGRTQDASELCGSVIIVEDDTYVSIL